MTANPPIGFIGLGLMGSAATKYLVAEGYAVAGYDIVADKVAAAEANGVKPAASPAEVARGSEIVIICVTSTAAVEEAVFGSGGVVVQVDARRGKSASGENRSVMPRSKLKRLVRNASSSHMTSTSSKKVSMRPFKVTSLLRAMA